MDKEEAKEELGRIYDEVIKEYTEKFKFGYEKYWIGGNRFQRIWFLWAEMTTFPMVSRIEFMRWCLNSPGFCWGYIKLRLYYLVISFDLLVYNSKDRI